MVDRLLNPNINWNNIAYDPDFLDELAYLALQIDDETSQNNAFYLGSISLGIRRGYVMNREDNKLFAECLINTLLYYCALW